MAYKRYLIKFVACIVTGVSIVMAFNYIVDPLQFYRKATFYEPRYSTEMRFQMPGIIRNTDYDTLIVGTSMTQNFYEDYVDKTLGVNSLNIALSGSSAREHALVAELALQNGDVENVFWEINFGSLYRDIDRVRDDQTAFPFHMYDENPLTDFKYLYSLFPIQVLMDKVQMDVMDYDRQRDLLTLYKFGDNQPPLEKEDYVDNLEAVTAEAEVQEGYGYEHLVENFETNILPFVEKYPDVNFTFFYTPYSIIGQLDSYNRNNAHFQAKQDFKETIFGKLIAYDNVAVYDFQAFEDITHNLANYMDTSHYFREINDFQIDYMAKHEPIQSIEENSEQVKQLETQIFNLTADKLRD